MTAMGQERLVWRGLVRNGLVGVLIASLVMYVLVGLLAKAWPVAISTALAIVLACLLTSGGKRWRTNQHPALKGWMVGLATFVLVMIGTALSGKPQTAPEVAAGAPSPAPASAPPTPNLPPVPKVTSYGDVIPALAEDAVSRASFQGLWPLTVDEGAIGCTPEGRTWFETNDGQRYALNGKARSAYPGPEPIWAMDEKFMAESARVAGKPAGVVRINITDLMTAAKALCANP